MNRTRGTGKRMRKVGTPPGKTKQSILHASASEADASVLTGSVPPENCKSKTEPTCGKQLKTTIIAQEAVESSLPSDLVFDSSQQLDTSIMKSYQDSGNISLQYSL